MRIKNFKEFTQQEGGTPMFENNNVATVDMKHEAKQHMTEADEKLSMAADAIYELKRMADYVKMDFPEVSKELGSHAESILEDIETLKDRVQKTINLIR